MAESGSQAYLNYLAERESSPVKFLSQRVFAPGQAQSVGFKVLYKQVLYQWTRLFDSLRDDLDLQIIHLVRRNGVKRFLSEYVVGTITFQHLCPADQLPPRVEPLIVPVGDLLHDLEKIAEQEGKVSEAFARPNYFRLTYEDTVNSDGKAILALQSFIGVEPACLSAPIRKILPDELQLIIKNFDEVERALRGTSFESMLYN